MSINLRHLEILYGLIGAREKFEDMTVQLIRSENPSADRVRVFRGDGGIDAFGGDLTDPAGVDVFQIKYFPEKIDDSQKDQIRDSFKRARDNSAFATRNWTLCLPIDMSVEERGWFEDWRSKQAGSGINIRPVWGATKIQELLMQNENRGIREQFFQQESPQRLREMSVSLQKLLEEFVGRVPKPEPILLEPRLETVNLKLVEPAGEFAAYAVLRARFRVTNKSSKSARVWAVKCEFLPYRETLAERFHEYPGSNSHDVILPSGTEVQNVEFGFLVHKNENPPLCSAIRGLRASSIRYRAVAEDSIGEPQTQCISEVTDDLLYNHILLALQNVLSWR